MHSCVAPRQTADACSRSFPALSCEFATLDVSDALGTVRGLGLHVLLCMCLDIGMQLHQRGSSWGLEAGNGQAMHLSLSAADEAHSPTKYAGMQHRHQARGLTTC